MLWLLPFTVQSGLERIRNVHRGVWQQGAAPNNSRIGTTSQRVQELDSELEEEDASIATPPLPVRRGRLGAAARKGKSGTPARESTYRAFGKRTGPSTAYCSGESTPDSQSSEDVEVEYAIEEREMASLMEDVRDALLVLDDADRLPRSAAPLQPRSRPVSPVTDSGIKWDSVRRGLTKITVARDEKSQPPSSRNPSFERAEFIGGLRHLITSLPSDLTPSETSTLRSSLPDSLASSLPSSASSSSARGFHGTSGPTPSLLHRLVKTIVAAHLRKYHVAGVLIGGAVDMARSAAKQVAAMSIVGDRTVGEAVASGVAWTVSGVAGGVADGLGEGLVIIQDQRRF
ncbi:unnamed protein product [Parascedosporium putredinis]|uniref:Uncharacterized protein n=1 Tax=Parascedosporium putredinis TaxID=1442378 RepID=A0A9P1GVC4_9PEZI|nr:unnamed protein product [Parascedosporium putredinis]CAI7987788.1 unnamed protein product [Parascedosporium putredinis]